MKLERFLQFCDGGRDYYTDADVPSGWPINHDESWIRFAYYDCSGFFTDRERELYERGYNFDCYVAVIHDNEYEHEEYELAHFPARCAEAAEELLQLAANAIYEED